MSELPASWVVQYRMPASERVSTGLMLIPGGIFAVFICGVVGFVAWRAFTGKLLPSPLPPAGELVRYGALGLVGLLFAFVIVRSAIGTSLDLLGAEEVLHGQVEVIREHRGTRGISYSMVVQGKRVFLPPGLASTLSVGAPVWVRVGRFERELNELARPSSDVPRR